MGGKSGAKEAKREAARIRREEAARQARIREGTSQINSTLDTEFDDDFFKDRAGAFVSYGTPQLEDQRSDAAKDLIFALTRSGNLDSSSRATKEGELQKLYDIQRQSIVDQGQAYANTAKTNIEDARSDLIKTLNVTGDAEAAASGAINRASALSAPDTFNPLSQLFADFTASLGSQYALERSEANAQKDYAKYNTGLFKPGRTTVTGA